MNYKITFLVPLVLLILGIIGYINNIYILLSTDPALGEVLVRVSGIFIIPLGAISGWF